MKNHCHTSPPPPERGADYGVSQDFFSPPIPYQAILLSDWEVSCFQASRSQNPPHESPAVIQKGSEAHVQDISVP